MDWQYAFLKDYTERLIEKGKSFTDIGLWNGKMGIAIFLLHVSRITQDEKYENEASELIDAVYKQLSLDLPFTFDKGLLGIGCGFEYIINQRFVNADSDEILSEIDLWVRNIIDFRLSNNLSLSEGVCGVGYYLYCRLKNREHENENMVVLKLKEYLIYLLDWMEELISKINIYQEFIDSYFLLVRFYELNVFNYKVEKLMEICLRGMADLNFPITDNYELLGIASLKALKPWI